MHDIVHVMSILIFALHAYLSPYRNVHEMNMVFLPFFHVSKHIKLDRYGVTKEDDNRNGHVNLGHWTYNAFYIEITNETWLECNVPYLNIVNRKTTLQHNDNIVVGRSQSKRFSTQIVKDKPHEIAVRYHFSSLVDNK